jgi:hypothetical protein
VSALGRAVTCERAATGTISMPRSAPRGGSVRSSAIGRSDAMILSLMMLQSQRKNRPHRAVTDSHETSDGERRLASERHRRAEPRRAHAHDLRDRAHDIEVHSEREQEIPAAPTRQLSARPCVLSLAMVAARRLLCSARCGGSLLWSKRDGQSRMGFGRIAFGSRSAAFGDSTVPRRVAQSIRLCSDPARASCGCR